ncbi:hypothetical protein K9L16_03665 [Candidatus Pacearchaeota archaeon]|nr:hypothetical protein [Candidatus Pacearchaeota archaeon]
MTQTIDMQGLRHLNLFSKITKVNTRFSCTYNGAIIFCVPQKFVSRAVGEQGKNVKKISQILGKKIKILAAPQGIEDAEEFIKNLVNPIEFKEIEVNDDEIIITGGRANKANLIGRGKKRLGELQKICRDYFNRELRVI